MKFNVMCRKFECRKDIHYKTLLLDNEGELSDTVSRVYIGTSVNKARVITTHAVKIIKFQKYHLD